MLRLFIFCTTLCLLTGLTGHAQQIANRPLPGDEPAVPLQNALVGTWEWRSGLDVFTMSLSIENNYVYPDGKSRTVLIGRHIFKKNGVIVENSFINNQKPTVFGLYPEDVRSIKVKYKDPTKSSRGWLQLSIPALNTNQLSFILTPTEGTVHNNDKVIPEASFTVPVRMTLTRIAF